MFLYFRLVVFPYSVIEPYTAATATHAGQYGISVIPVSVFYIFVFMHFRISSISVCTVATGTHDGQCGISVSSRETSDSCLS